MNGGILGEITEVGDALLLEELRAAGHVGFSSQLHKEDVLFSGGR
jgi:hypothetical protein